MWQGLLPVPHASSPQDPAHGGVPAQVSRMQ
ncbi:unnamed protein product [Acanthoscelides obtectus]|uniref:Uncharacterized protein n=1 Tax=Acanthoscelides obtectus TaxID=200917 RepID=A0A9P0M449_ACAOB|nr:unnamed protein product [Acanthoscelides obtectus]CAK1631804.1 hypothetical protein AOBTE_LOCUS7172 [Acanthoscelides obtectus]